MAKPLEQACLLHVLHATLSSGVTPGAPEAPLFAESSPGRSLLFCVSISLSTSRKRGHKAEWGRV